jgi:hypothetical protein
MKAVTLFSKLRIAGATIRTEGGRLIVEARPGVLTAEVRTELARHKPALIAMLEARKSNPEEDRLLPEGCREIAELLAVAYRRYIAIPRVEQHGPRDSVQDTVANSPGQSVHGVVS